MKVVRRYSFSVSGLMLRWMVKHNDIHGVRRENVEIKMVYQKYWHVSTQYFGAVVTG
jgi:hypothetical protein